MASMRSCEKCWWMPAEISGLVKPNGARHTPLVKFWSDDNGDEVIATAALNTFGAKLA